MRGGERLPPETSRVNCYIIAFYKKFARARNVREKRRYKRYIGSEQVDLQIFVCSYISFFGATFVATGRKRWRVEKYSRYLKKCERRLKKYCRRLEKCERRLEKYCRRLEKCERYFKKRERRLEKYCRRLENSNAVWNCSYNCSAI
ncbi:MAG: SNF7 family protein [Prevotella sp.]|nr:SNF7 family protein [Prevotella sp.]